MRFCLVQHGDSVAEQADPQRPLSAMGRQQVEAIARPLASASMRPARTAHSGKLRVWQTVGLLAMASPLPSAASASNHRAGLIEIELTSGVRLRVDAEVDGRALGRVLAALRDR